MFKIRREGSFVRISGDTLGDIEDGVHYLLRKPVDRAFIITYDAKDIDVYIGPLDKSDAKLTKN